MLTQQAVFMSQYHFLRPSDVEKRPEVQVSICLEQLGGGARARRAWTGGKAWTLPSCSKLSPCRQEVTMP